MMIIVQLLHSWLSICSDPDSDPDSDSDSESDFGADSGCDRLNGPAQDLGPQQASGACSFDRAIGPATIDGASQ